jgi:NhaP-type Na+/H+ or K+/H+ antiporter
VFGTALKTDWIVLRRQFWHILVLAVPILLANVFISSAFFWGGLDYKSVTGYRESLWFCAIVAPHGQIVVEKMCN